MDSYLKRHEITTNMMTGMDTEDTVFKQYRVDGQHAFEDGCHQFLLSYLLEDQKTPQIICDLKRHMLSTRVLFDWLNQDGFLSVMPPHIVRLKIMKRFFFGFIGSIDDHESRKIYINKYFANIFSKSMFEDVITKRNDPKSKFNEVTQALGISVKNFEKNGDDTFLAWRDEWSKEKDVVLINRSVLSSGKYTTVIWFNNQMIGYEIGGNKKITEQSAFAKALKTFVEGSKK
ncbi:hypothetical protein IIV31_102R [Armadillidium vulgare iridescent virus]|uniref:Uncharacterized protein n=1 Tax=Armadillidium vulgare iridescent virus TaxID=72201 RepID=A0A068QLQ2_9VIRU|nr:hypothetical protein IIV31_102R [Armadillidium vulgare iridescent virus]CCV02474.1 hypothetical protein IIV31_102R [Armadillidium vulgare iridescent virus]